MERDSGFAPLPCPMCTLIARCVRETGELIGDRPLWPDGIPYVYQYLCAFCGLASTHETSAPDADAARRFGTLLMALATGRFCAVGDGEMTFLNEHYDQTIGERLGADFPKYRTIKEEFGRGMRELYARYKPRAPYMCVIEGCSCKHPKAERRGAA